MADDFVGNVALDVAALEAYVANAEAPPEGKAAATIVAEAWNSLLEAKVLVATFAQDGNQVTETPDGTIVIDAKHGQVAFEYHGGGPNTVWDGEKLPPIDGLIQALAYALVTILNSPPAMGPRPWPKN